MESTKELPTLDGTEKQIAWANDIRTAFAKSNPEHEHLTTITSAKQWIDGYIKDQEGRLPALEGTEKQIAWAMKIRARVLQESPYNKALFEAKSAKFWITHKSEMVKTAHTRGAEKKGSEVEMG